MTLLESREEASPLILPIEPATNRLSAVAQLLVAMIAILLVVGAVSVGTMASFTGSTDNETPVFSVGTLILSNTIPEASACLSTSGPNNDAECDGMFDLEVAKPGDSASADIDLANVGAMDGDLTLHADGPCVSGDAVSSYHGAGDLCDGLLIAVQAYGSEAARAGNSTAGGSCLFGGNAGGEACDFDDPTATVSDFVAEHPDFSDAIAMGPMPTDDQRFLRVSVLLPADAGNTYQGRTASFGLTWRLAQ